MGPRMDRRIQLGCVGCGPVFAFCLLFGLVVLAGYIPPPSPLTGAEAITRWYVDSLTSIRLGLLLALFGSLLLFPWGLAVAFQTARSERKTPVMSCLQIVCTGAGTIGGIIGIIVWCAAAFRPDAIDPKTTWMLNDLGWLLFLLTVPPFALWIAAFGVAVLVDRQAHPVYPRWMGYYSLWTTFAVCPAGMILLFKSGPFAFNGLIGFYIPVGQFFIWMLLTTWLTIRAINRQAEEDESATESVNRPGMAFSAP